MNAFYKVAITKQNIGSAVQFKEPPLQGKVLVKVLDSSTAGDFMLIVVDCNDSENKTNLGLPGVEKKSEEQAIKLATKYFPKRKRSRQKHGLLNKKRETLPALDLKKILKEKMTGTSSKKLD